MECSRRFSSKKRLTSWLSSIALVSLAIGSVQPVRAASGAALVKDINTSASSAVSAVPTQIVSVGSSVYFAADDPSLGSELWRSTGSTAGTTLVADIYPGSGSAAPSNLTVVGSTVYFSANNGDSGTELWSVNGSIVKQVIDLAPGAASSSPSQLINVNGTLFFVANDGAGTKLWKLNGTTPTPVALPAAQAGAAPSDLTVMGSMLYFVYDTSSSGSELWSTDGTTANIVLNIAAGVASARPAELEVVGSSLYFTADDAINGRELWKSDGTSAGTSLVKDIYTGRNSSAPKDLVAVGATLFFSANDGVTGTELWKSDGTDVGTKLVRDVYPGGRPKANGQIEVYSSSPKYLTASGGYLFFRAEGTPDGAAPGSTTGYELWRSDGVSETTVLVRDINQGPDGSSLENLTDVNGTLFFQADNNTDGRELWQVQGIGNATEVKNINPGKFASSPDLMLNSNGTLYFRADDGAGRSLWKSDGTSGGTVQIKAVVPGSSSNPAEFTPMNGKLYFAANSSFGRELWSSDGSNNGTIRVSSPSQPRELTVVGSKLYFIAQSGTRPGLWVSSGSGSATLIQEFTGGVDIPAPANLTEFSGKLYFTAISETAGQELWVSDGTTAGTTVLKDVVPGEDGSAPSDLVVANNLLFFVAGTEETGRRLYRSNGTDLGTAIVNNVSAPADLVSANDRLYFTATGGSGRAVWMSNGGSTLAINAKPGSSYNLPANLVATNGKLYFTAQDAAGQELWTTNGTPIGTFRVKDIAPGGASSLPQELVGANGRVFFRANNGTSGTELWVSDGTDAGTMLTKDIVSGASGSVPQSIRQIRSSGRVLFSAYTPQNGTELWISDGTPEGTKLQQELAAGSASSSPSEFTLAGSNPANLRIYFRAQDASTGVELWSILASELNTAPVVTSADLTGHANRPIQGMFSATDAERDLLQFTITKSTTNGTVVVADAAAGTFTYTPNPGFLGTDNFTFKVNDGLAESSEATITITVTNTPPVVSAGSLVVHVNRAQNGVLAATDADGDPITYRIVDAPQKGTVTLTNPATGAYTYTPTANAFGSDSFTFVANDGISDSPKETVSVEITNTAPVANDVDVALGFDKPYSGSLAGSDADNDPLTYAVVTPPTKGVATITNAATGAFTYTPNPGAVGVDSFTYKVNDGFTDSAVGTVRISFGNALPVAYDKAFEVAINGQLQGSLNGTDADPSDTLTFKIVAPPSNGQFNVDAASGMFTYAPNRNFKGVVTFKFAVSDGKNDSKPATVTITVQRPLVFLPLTVR